MDLEPTSGHRLATLTATIIWGVGSRDRVPCLATLQNFAESKWLSRRGVAQPEPGSPFRPPAHIDRGRSSLLPLHAGQRRRITRPLTRCEACVEVDIFRVLSQACWPRLGPDRGLAASPPCPAFICGTITGARSGPFRCPDLRPRCVIRSRRPILFRGGITGARGHEGENEGQPGPPGPDRGQPHRRIHGKHRLRLSDLPRTFHLRRKWPAMGEVNLVLNPAAASRDGCVPLRAEASEQHRRDLNRATDHLFAGLLAFEWLAAD